jgi:hypothetical protein
LHATCLEDRLDVADEVDGARGGGRQRSALFCGEQGCVNGRRGECECERQAERRPCGAQGVGGRGGVNWQWGRVSDDGHVVSEGDFPR